MQTSRKIAIRSVRANETGDRDAGRIGKEFGDFGDAADILRSGLRRESQVLVEAEADVVAVEAIGRFIEGLAEERLFEGNSDSRFSRCREAGEPNRQTLLSAEVGAKLRGERTGVEGYVAGLNIVVSATTLEI